MGLTFNKFDFDKLKSAYAGDGKWRYVDMNAPIELLLSSGFFDRLAGAVDPGDIIYIIGKDGGALRYVAATTGYTVKLGELK
jgi:hypothetical protein